MFQIHLQPSLHPSIFTLSEEIFDYYEDGGKNLLRNMENKLPINTTSYLTELLFAPTKV
jgi:hypothetical protein